MLDLDVVVMGWILVEGWIWCEEWGDILRGDGEVGGEVDGEFGNDGGFCDDSKMNNDEGITWEKVNAEGIG